MNMISDVEGDKIGNSFRREENEVYGGTDRLTPSVFQANKTRLIARP
ncbi:unnamed protein product [Strongylus vulgaris]|uniref:Uncharacterized protein n=1 Tax=Strongylus vulgaris TaxID=40348 RepID=A0A3P7JMM5_STRVU|nr:unnamed protein product [Strongylus vulgaris]